MKNIIGFAYLLIGLLSINSLYASDDVYDAPVKRKVKTNTATTVSESVTTNPSVENNIARTDNYVEEGTSRNASYAGLNENYRTDNSIYSDDYNTGSSFGYTDRIRRFHNPSVQFSYGWNNWNNNFYDPWNSYNNTYGWNNWNNYSFSPSWSYGYSNFYNPFWNTTAVVLFQPGFNSWYNTSYYNPWNSWNSYSWGISPYCSNAIFNNGYSNYSGYYDSNRKNVVYAPRSNSYGNTTTINQQYNNPYKNNYPSNTNNGWNNATNNTNSSSNINNTTSQPNKQKWTNSNNDNGGRNTINNNNNSGGWSNPYKQNNNSNNNYSTPNNNWNNGSNSNSNGSGIKTGTRPK